MKVIIEFNVDWENYSDISDELIIKDMFENWKGKEGIEINSYKIEK